MARIQIIESLRSELSRYSNPKYFMNAQQFEKQKLKETMVLRTAIVRKVSAEHFREIKSLPKDEILKLCEELLKDGNGNLGEIARDWAYRCQKRYEKKDFRVFEQWLKKYIRSWGSCDHLCVHPLGHLILKFSELAPKMKKWTRSKNLWERRASAVALIPALRRKLLLKEAFATAGILLQDKEDLVQKGYGWMLKEASNRYPKEVFKYVMKNKKRIPRTALRYAIEKMPKGWKKEAMSRDF